MPGPTSRLQDRPDKRSERFLLGAALLVLLILFFLPGGVIFSPLVTILMFVGIALQKRSASTSHRERRRLAFVALSLSMLWLGVAAFWISSLSVGEPTTQVQFRELPPGQVR